MLGMSLRNATSLAKLVQISAHFGYVKPKKEVQAQSKNLFSNFINLSQRQPKHLELVAAFVGPRFNLFHLRRD